ncbi:hypothetical protein D8B26_003858 [Coccidioides posadasii str. Silveira]|uniref:Uncharacterized protein n=2 Tax=Coccidioides posadasii TaxID=199306 RepID=E9D961_COCPS|nr:conserved hypothetical protein [Coccidioides posadasii str. Silveira]KMM70004.1 hypothetical protein CPAG_06316 [Coccidioides posadasii RMSCC 3488]QVM09194.1 hypothetical protein D8B26_003858 [Coccidioides posadasii str. Silveira]
MSLQSPKTPPRRSLLAKQPLPKPSKQVPRLLNPASKGAEIQLQMPLCSNDAGTAGSNAKRNQDRELRVIEFDASRVPQPFLDGEKVLQEMKDLRMVKEAAPTRSV